MGSGVDRNNNHLQIAKEMWLIMRDKSDFVSLKRAGLEMRHRILGKTFEWSENVMDSPDKD